VDFDLSEEQVILGDSVRRFIAEEFPFDRRLKVAGSEPGFPAEHWARFAELGWLAASIPERYGGLGGSPVEVMLIMERFGRGLYASPYIATVVLGANLVLFAGSEEQKRALLPAVASGRLKLAFAFAEPDSRFELAAVETRARRDGAGFVIEGSKAVVFYGVAADKVIVLARTSAGVRDANGLSLFLCESGSPGLLCRHYATQDGGRASEIRFDRVRVPADALLGPMDGALPIAERVLDHGIAALCAEASGAMWAAYEATLAYAKTRKQFGQALGSFQALQHRLVDMYMRSELAQSMVYEATAGLGSPDPVTRAMRASAAKVQIGRAGRLQGQEAVQLHGGVGMTMELPVGHYFMRLAMIESTFGDTSHHLGRYAQLSRRADREGGCA